MIDKNKKIYYELDIDKNGFIIDQIYNKDLYNKKIWTAKITLLVCMFLISIIFFVLWIFGIEYESLVVINHNWFSSIFYFLNPVLWKFFILDGNNINYFYEAINLNAIKFLVFFYLSIVFFLLQIISSLFLLGISSYYDNSVYKNLAILGMIPILSAFLITIYLLYIGMFYICQNIDHKNKNNIFWNLINQIYLLSNNKKYNAKHPLDLSGKRKNNFLHTWLKKINSHL